MTKDELLRMAEKAEKDGDHGLATILFTYLGALTAGEEEKFINHVAFFAHQRVHEFDYSRWLRGDNS